MVQGKSSPVRSCDEEKKNNEKKRRKIFYFAKIFSLQNLSTDLEQLLV